MEVFAGISVHLIKKFGAYPKPPNLTELGFQSGGRIWYATFSAAGRNYYISFVKEIIDGEVTWMVGFADAETARSGRPDELVGAFKTQPGAARDVFDAFAKALFFALDKLKVNRWLMAGEPERQRVYQRIVKRNIEKNPKLAEEWEIEEHGVGEVPYHEGEAVKWLVRRKQKFAGISVSEIKRESSYLVR